MAIENLLVMTGGGPTAVLNATLFGIIREASKSVDVLTIKGALNGIKGIIDDDLICLYPYGDAIQLLNTPGTVLGTSRHKVSCDEELDKIVATLKRHKITQLIMIGGNDTMMTALIVDNYLKKVGYQCKIVGVLSV